MRIDHAIVASGKDETLLAKDRRCEATDSCVADLTLEAFWLEQGIKWRRGLAVKFKRDIPHTSGGCPPLDAGCGVNALEYVLGSPCHHLRGVTGRIPSQGIPSEARSFIGVLKKS